MYSTISVPKIILESFPHDLSAFLTHSAEKSFLFFFFLFLCFSAVWGLLAFYHICLQSSQFQTNEFSFFCRFLLILSDLLIHNSEKGTIFKLSLRSINFTDCHRLKFLIQPVLLTLAHKKAFLVLGPSIQPMTLPTHWFIVPSKRISQKCLLDT